MKHENDEVVLAPCWIGQDAPRMSIGGYDMNGQQKKPVTLNREELYRQVWTTPMIRLG